MPQIVFVSCVAGQNYYQATLKILPKHYALYFLKITLNPWSCTQFFVLENVTESCLRPLQEKNNAHVDRD